VLTDIDDTLTSKGRLPAVGVANVHAFENQLDPSPTYVTHNEGGFGFAEMVAVLLDR
jgi:hypothetical protein